jgi:hypothetical protein
MNKNKSNKVKMNKFKKILELPFWYDNELRSKYWSQKEIDAENTKDAKVTLKINCKVRSICGKSFFLCNVFISKCGRFCKMAYQSGLSAKDNAHPNYIILTVDLTMECSAAKTNLTQQ